MGRVAGQIGMRGLGALGLLSVLTVAVYAPVASYGFVAYDDGTYVTDNPRVLAGLSLSNIKWAFEGSHIGHYHPLTWLSLMLDASLFGADARAFHLHSLVLHLLNVALVYWLFAHVTGRALRSAAVAFVFALHPLQVEPVAWIASRKDVLSALFALVCMHLYVRWVERPAPGRYLGVVFVFVCALLTKPMVITLPLVLLLLDRWPLDRFDFAWSDRRRMWAAVREKWPLFGLSAMSAWATVAAVRVDAVLVQRPGNGLGARLLSVPGHLLQYLEHALVPIDLVVHYPRDEAQVGVGESLLALGAVGLVLALGMRRQRTAPYVLVGTLMFFGMLVPVAGVVTYGAHTIADRYTYLPIIGLAVALVWGAAQLGNRCTGGRVIVGTLGGCAGVAMLALSWLQLSFWASNEALFARAVQVYPQSARMRNQLAGELISQQRYDEARVHLSAALKVRPNYRKAQNNIALLALRQGRLSEAIEHYRALIADREDAVALHNLAIALAQTGNPDAAETHLRRAITLDPEYASPYLNLAVLLRAQGRPAEAQNVIEAGLRVRPADRQLRAAID